MEAKTTISSEKNLTEKVQRVRPKIKVAQSHTDLATMNNTRTSNVSLQSLRSSSGNMTMSENTFVPVKDNSVIVIESPKYCDVLYGDDDA